MQVNCFLLIDKKNPNLGGKQLGNENSMRTSTNSIIIGKKRRRTDIEVSKQNKDKITENALTRRIRASIGIKMKTNLFRADSRM